MYNERNRLKGSDAMFFAEGAKALRRGNRRAERTETCRACLVWPKDMPDLELRGVIMDLTPHGMLIRMLDPLPPDTEIRIQMMRDEEYEEPLADPFEGTIVRNVVVSGGFTDHGVQLKREEIKRPESKPVQIRRLRPRLTRRTRMHNIDFTVGHRGQLPEK